MLIENNSTAIVGAPFRIPIEKGGAILVLQHKQNTVGKASASFAYFVDGS